MPNFFRDSFSCGPNEQAPKWQADANGNTYTTGISAFADNLVAQTATKGLVLKVGSGTNTLVGTFVCNGASNVTVNNTLIAITDIILYSLNTVGGTVGAVPVTKTITANSGFAVAGTASDTSTYNYMILKSTP